MQAFMAYVGDIYGFKYVFVYTIELSYPVFDIA